MRHTPSRRFDHLPRIVRRFGLWSVCAACLVTGLACSSGTSRDESGQAATTTAEAVPDDGKTNFLKHGNDICAEMNDRSLALSQSLPPGGPTAADELAFLYRENVVYIEEAVAALRALPQPVGEEEQLALMYADVDQLVAFARQLADYAEAGDQANGQALSDEANELQSATNEAFTDYGLVECGQGG